MTTKTLPDSTTTSYYYNGSGVTLVNNGVQGRPGASGMNFGFVVGGNNDTLINNGTAFGQRSGIYGTGSGDGIINAAGGQIIATYPVDGAVNFQFFVGTVTNYGTISGFAGATNGDGGNAVQLQQGGLVTNFGTLQGGGVLIRDSLGTVVNSGVILGNVAYGAVYMEAGGTVTNLTGGLISSNGAAESYRGGPPYGVSIAGGVGTVTNAGTIDGGSGYAVLLATGFQNRVVVDPGAVFLGIVNGGSAVDATLELASKASQGTLSGVGSQFVNFGTLAFDPSASWRVNANTAIASTTITGFGAGDTIDLSGFVAVSDTFSANTLVLTNSGNAHVTLHVQGTFTTANFSIANDGSGGTDLGYSTIAPADLVYGQTIDETGIVATSETVSAGTMTLYNGASPVGTVSVGTSLSSGDFILRSDGAGGTDVIVSTVFGTYANGVTLLTNPTTIANTANITNSGGSALYGANVTPGWSVTNYGVVDGGTTAVGIELRGGSGSITNAAGGTISGQYGLRIYNNADFDIVNLAGGTIAATGTNADRGIDLESAVGTVTNAGLITSQPTGDFDVVVELDGGGTVINAASGTISGGWGVLIGGAGTVVNAGTISGTYSGEFAVGLGNGDRLIVDPGAVFVGAVNGGWSGGSSILELASATSAGTLVATNFTNFSTIDFDAGAAWTLAGTTNNLSGSIVGFTLGDTIDLTGFAAVSDTFASNTLVLTDSGSAQETLHVQGDFLSGNFHLSSDGSGGTDIAFGATPLNYGQTIDETGIIATSETVTAGTMTLFNGASPVGTVSVGTSLSSGDFILRSDGSGGTDVILDTVFGIYNSGVTLLTNPTTIASTGKAINTLVGGKAVSGGAGTNWTLVNQGLVSETVPNGIGISFAQSGIIANEAGGTVTAQTNAIVLAGGGYVTNASGGVISGKAAGGISAAAVATVVNAGQILANVNSGSGIVLSAGGTVTNQASGTITADNGIRISGATGSVVNQGRIFANYNKLHGNDGVYLGSGGEVVNGASAGTVSAAYIGGYLGGVWFGPTGSDTLINYGTVYGLSGPGAELNTGTVINGPSGATGALIIGHAATALQFDGAGTVQNAGTILNINSGGASPGSYYYGVVLKSGGVINNVGTKSLIEGYIGVYGEGGATVTNAGTIGSSYSDGVGSANYPHPLALRLGTGTNRLIVDPGAAFIGTVTGTPATGTGTNTLEFASAAAAGTISSLGTQFVGFPQITVDAGADWVISGSNSIASGVTLTNAGIDTVTGTLTNAGLITGAMQAIGLGTGGYITNQAGGLISATALGNIAVDASGAGTLVNAGDIAGGAAAGFGFYLAAGGSITNQSGGVITGEVAIAAYGLATITNAGSIGGGNTGVYLKGGGTVTNQSGGTIGGTGYAAFFGSGHTNLLVFDPGAVFTGNVGGGNPLGYAFISTLELASGASIGTLSGLGVKYADFAQVNVDAGATWTLSGQNELLTHATLSNAGTILDTGNAGLDVAGGYLLNQATGRITSTSNAAIYGVSSPVSRVVNLGTISGPDGVVLTVGGSVVNGASGTTTALITATGYGVEVAGATGTITNWGTITGASHAIYLVNGGAITNLSGGTIRATSGYAIYAGYQNLTVTVVNAGLMTSSGAGGLNLQTGGSVTNQSSGRIVDGGAGVYFKYGTVTNAGYIGGQWAVKIAHGGTVINQSGGTLDGGSNAVLFSSGYTNLVVDDPGAVFVGAADGGNAIGAAYISTLELASGASAGTLSGLGTQFVDFAQVTVASGANWDLSGANSIASGVTLTNSGTDAVTGTLVNAGLVTGNAQAIVLGTGGLISNQSGGVISATATSGIAVAGSGAGTLVNAGSIEGSNANGYGVSLAAGGTITNQSGGTISGYDGIHGLGAAATVMNTGSVVGYRYGLYLGGGGLVTNQSGGVISGPDAVIGQNAALSLVNLGTITGTSDGVRFFAGGSVTNASGGTVISNTGIYASGGTPGTVVNAGGITGGASGQGFGIRMSAIGDSVTNQSSGTIIADYGIWISSGTVINAGDISAGTDGVLVRYSGTFTNQSSGTIAASIGVLGLGAATVVNAGTLIGSAYSVQLLAGATNRLVIDPGATFSGVASGGNTIGASSISTLELASSASTGTLSGFGSQYINFAQVTIDAGAQWDIVGGDATTALGGATISGFGYGDTIDVTNFAATGDSFSGNHLTLTNGGGTVTLDVQGSFISQQFRITNDGATGTDITLGPVTLAYGDTFDEAGIVATSETVAGGVMTLYDGGSPVGTVGVGGTLDTSDFTLQPDGASGTDVIVSTVFGTYASGLTLLTNPTTIAATASVSNGAVSAAAVIGLTGTDWTLTNFGSVSESGSYSTGISLASGGTIINASGGIVSAASSGIRVGNNATVTNQSGGTISGANGVLASGSGIDVVNSGLINGSSRGVTFTSGGTVSNLSGGTIESTSFAVVVLSGAATITNAGVIAVSGGGGGAGIYINHGGLISNQSGGQISGLFAIEAITNAATVVNAGSIGGTGANGDGVKLAAGGTVTNQSGGVISGNYGIWASIAAAAVINAGTLAGSVSGAGVELLTGGSVTNQSGGTITGLKAVNVTSGSVTNAGSIGGNTTLGTGAGVQLVGGGSFTNQSGGTVSGFAGVYGETSAATVVNAGGIYGNTVSGQGVSLAAGGSVTNLSGGVITGFDGILAAGGASVVNAGSIGGTTAVVFGAGAANRLVFDPGAVFSGSVDGGNTIGSGSTSTLELASGASAGTLSGLGTQYLNFAQVMVDTGASWVLAGGNTVVAGATLTNGGTLTDTGTLTNAGLITGASQVILLDTGALITNQSGGIIEATGTTGAAIVGSGAGTVVNAGQITGGMSGFGGMGISLAVGGSITNQSGGTIAGFDGIYASAASTSILNLGDIAGNATRGSGIVLFAGGTVTNEAGASITGTVALAAFGTATVVNAGYIADSLGGIAVDLRGGGAVTNQSGGTLVGRAGVYADDSVDVVNGGLIVGTASSGLGIYMYHGGSVTNLSGGTITGGRFGVGAGAAAAVVNAGDIAGTYGTGIGVDLQAAGTITNQAGGTISGGAGAVAFASSFTNRLVIDPGAVFSGLVDGGNTIGSGAVSTLELGSGASTGTLTGFGSQYINFAQVTLDAGAQWDIVGSDATTALAGATISGFGYGDTIDVTNFAATGDSFSGNQLTLTNGGGTVTLDIPGTFFSPQFRITNDGGSGTDITVQPLTLLYGDTVDEAGIVATSETVTGGVMTLYDGASPVGTIAIGGTLNTSDFILSPDGSSGTDVIVSTVFGTYTNSGVTLLINPTTIAGTASITGSVAAGIGVKGPSGTAWTLVNQGLVSETGTASLGISFASAGTIINASGGVVAGSSGGIDLAAGGAVTNQSGGTISGIQGLYALTGAASVVNAGSIGGSVTLGSGIVLDAGGSITNVVGGTISGSYGVKASGSAATVVNAGSIGDGSLLPTGAAIALKHGGLIVNQAGGEIIAGLLGVYFGGAAGTIVNAGSVGGSTSNGEGIIFTTAGAVTNQSGGVITGRYGIRALSGAVTVVNAGSIGGNTASGSGVNLSAGGSLTNQFGGVITGQKAVNVASGTVTNAGSIGGTTAVAFGAGSANRLVYDPGAVFSGVVDGGNTIGGAFVSTLELASAASAGTLSGLGTQFVNFADVAVDTDASWTLSGANTLAAGITLASAGALTASGTFQNDGTIIGTDPAYGINIAAGAVVTNLGSGVIKGVEGVVLRAGATLINAGTIDSTSGISGSAVIFFGDNAKLIDDPGSVFYGFIQGDGGVLELASGSSAGTITALGNTVTNFTSLVFDAGARWTVAGIDNAAGLGTLGIGGFASGDTIDLTNFVAVSETFSNNTLVLTSAIDVQETLNIQGAFASDNFVIGTDGDSGTDISFVIPPTIVAGGTVSFTGGGPAVALDSTLGITDPESGTLVSGTVSIGGFLAGDTLNFSAQDGIIGNFDSLTGMLTLTGSATLADYQAAMESITYSFAPADGDPTAGGDTTRTIDWVVNDGTNASPLGSSTLDTVHVAPTITAGGTVSFTGGGSAVVLDSTLTLADVDSGGLLNSGTVSIGGFLAGDTLNFGDQDGIIGNFDSLTGTLTLSGSATVADYQAALESITYGFNPADGDPTDATRTIGWVVNDGASTNSVSNTGTSTLDTVHVGPTITAGGTVAYVADGAATVLDASVTVADVDSTGIIHTATVSIGTGFTLGDLLNFADQNGITGGYDSATGTLTLDGNATIADYQAALDSITYSYTPDGGDPTAGGTDPTRTVSWIVNDGVDASGVAFSTLDLSLPAPVIAGSVAGQAVTDEVTIDPFSGVSISDPNSDQTETVTITVTNGGTVTDADGILSGSGLTKTGTGTYALAAGSTDAVTAALDALVFTPTEHQVAPGETVTTGFTLAVTDTLSQSATDGVTSVVATAVNDDPVITGAVAGQTTTDEAAISPFLGVGISDVDVGQTETVTVTLSNAANGVLSNLDGGSFAGGVYSVSGSDAAVTTAVDGLVFTPTAHQVAPGSSVTTTFTISVTDTAGGVGSDDTTTVGATAGTDDPVITGTVAGQATTDEAAIDPLSGVVISDVDVGQTETVTVTLSNAANGVLSNLDGGSFAGGVYSITGSDSAVTTALDGLVFTPTAHQVAPGDSVTTTFSIATTDTAGSVDGDDTTTVVATAVNDAPVVTGTVAGQRVSNNATIQPFSGVTIIDPDVGASETVSITLSYGGTPTDVYGTLSGAGLTKTGNGLYTLAVGSPDAVTSALDALVFTPIPDSVVPDRTITTDMTLTVTDGIVGSPTVDTTTSVNSIACFAAGTRIATPRGAVAVERLREGDLVLTVSGKARPVQWIGRRTLDCTRHIAPERVKPVRIAAHAFGADRPKRALLLSPDHSVFIEEVMIPIKHLINGATVVQLDVPSVTYYHIELESHDVVLAEGLPAETYLETGGRAAFENGGGAMELHPDFAPDENRVGMVWRNFAYAPLIGGEGQLDRVRVRLALQAVMLGQQAVAAPGRAKRPRRVVRG